MILADIVVAVASFLLAYYIRNSVEPLAPIQDYALPVVIFIVLWTSCLFFSEMYRSFRLKKISEILFSIYQTTYISFFIFVGVCYLFHITEISRVLVVLMFVNIAGLTAIEKLSMILFLRWLRQKGFNYRNVLVVGTGPRAQRLVHELDGNKDLGFKIIGLLDQDAAMVGRTVAGYPVIDVLSNLPKVTRDHVVDQVFFVVPRSWVGDIEEAVLFLEKLGVRVDVAIDYFNMAIANAKQSEFFGVPFLTFETAPNNFVALFLKRMMDVVLSAAALIILSPLFLLLAFLIRISSKGPVFFVQKRVSMNGRVFNLFKFRTMVEDAEAKLADLQHLNEMKGPAFKMEKDPRITFVGALLRKTSLDELPQFWNVLRGDMSLVGPRPPLPKEVEQYDDWQRRRLSMRPGITCIWQIQGRNRITDFKEWARLDLQYIDNWSLWLDIEILFKTVPAVLLGVGAK